MPYPYNIPGFPGAPLVPMSLPHQYLAGAPAGVVSNPMDQLQRLALNGPNQHQTPPPPPPLQDKVRYHIIFSVSALVWWSYLL